MPLRLNLSVPFITLVRFFLVIVLNLCCMDSFRKFTNLLKSERLKVRLLLFPYITKFMDKRLDSYLSLFYECELYSLEELKDDLVQTLHVSRNYAVDVTLDRTPIYQQLTLF